MERNIKKNDVKIKSFFQQVNKSLLSPVKAYEYEIVRVGVLEHLLHSKPKWHLNL